MWDSFKQKTEYLKPNTPEHVIKTAVQLAMSELNELYEEDFFKGYPGFDALALKFQENFEHYLDLEAEYLQYAARAHFYEKFGNAIDISFAKKPKGSTVSLIK